MFYAQDVALPTARGWGVVGRGVAERRNGHRHPNSWRTMCAVPCKPYTPRPTKRERERDTAHDRVRGKYIGQGRVNIANTTILLCCSQNRSICVFLCVGM
jgi:hypothetical protein